MAESRQQEKKVTLSLIWVRENVITTVLVIFILVSLALQALTIGSLWRVRSVLQRQLDLSSKEVASVRQQSVRYNFPVDQTFPINTTVVISETVTVPLSITVPISQTISLPINTPVGPIEFDVPLNFSVPVSDTIEVPISKEIPFQANVPVQTEFPIDIDLSQPPLGDILRRFEQALQELRDNLR